MVTGAALATVNRLPVLLLPGDIFATRRPGPVLQQLEQPGSPEMSRERLLPAGVALLGPHRRGPSSCSRRCSAAMRVLTDPGRDRRGHAGAAAGRPGRGVGLPGRALRAAACGASRGRCPTRGPAGPRGGADSRGQAAADRRRRRRHLLARRRTRCARSPSRPASRSARRRPARARCPTTIRWRSARSASTGTFAANRFAREADLVIGVGTRYCDFTTASQTAFQHPDVRFVNINVAAVRRLQARRRCRWSATRARRSRRSRDALAGWRVDAGYRARAARAERRVGRRGRSGSTRADQAPVCRARAR